MFRRNRRREMQDLIRSFQQLEEEEPIPVGVLVQDLPRGVVSHHITPIYRGPPSEPIQEVEPLNPTEHIHYDFTEPPQYAMTKDQYEELLRQRREGTIAIQRREEKLRDGRVPFLSADRSSREAHKRVFQDLAIDTLERQLKMEFDERENEIKSNLEALKHLRSDMRSDAANSELSDG